MNPSDSPVSCVLSTRRPLWVRGLWLCAGVVALLLGIAGIFLPLLPTTPFVLLAAACFSRGSVRCERWLLQHPRFGPMVRDWRRHRAVPLRAKQLALVMMTIGSVVAAITLPRLKWLPAACCAAGAWWLWHLPTREDLPAERDAHPDHAESEGASSGNSGRV
jgi:uncharacterized membrane protein YbaN (DUF454 family)